VLASLAEWHGHTVCSHSESVPSKYLNGTMSSRYLKHGQQTISPVPFSPLQPRHTVSVRALSSSSLSSSIRVSFIPDNSTGRHPRRSTFRYEILSLCVLRSPPCRAGRDFIPDSLRTYRARGQGVRVSSDLCDVGTMERTTIVKEREKNAACCMLRDTKRRTTLMRSDCV
jgi:hypothetical protein